jgi:hypothetical protein
VVVANNVLAVAAGQFYSLFVKNDGTLWAMGRGNLGQLGIGNTNQQSLPVQVGLTVASLGEMNEASHSLTVGAPTTLVLPLADQAVIYGQPVIFSLNVTNGTGPFTYQWQINGANIVNATNSSYNISSAGFLDAGIYTGIVTGLAGSACCSATLTVSPPSLSLVLTQGDSAGASELSFQVLGAPGSSYVLQASTNLIAPAWMPVQTNDADANGICIFTMTNLTRPWLFFRVASP